MKKDIAGAGTESSAPTFEVLESLVREQAQTFIQRVLEEEVTELLGREKSERIEVVDAPKGYRNGYGEPRKLTMSSGTITVRRPRVRGMDERFESRVLPLFARRTRGVAELIPEL
jgi:putative transposase